MTEGTDDSSKPGQTGPSTELQPSRRDHLLELLGMFFALFAGSLLLFALGYKMSEGSITIEWVVATALTDLGFCLLVPVLLRRGEVLDWKLPHTGIGWAKEFGWGLLLLLAVYGCNTLVSMLIAPFDLNPSTHWDNPLADPATLAAFCVFMPIVGLSEELLFRVYMQTRLTQVLRGRGFLSVLIGAVVFALVHGYPLAGTLGVLVLGLVLGFSYQANGKIPRLVIAHTLNNVLVALLTLI